MKTLALLLLASSAVAADKPAVPVKKGPSLPQEVLYAVRENVAEDWKGEPENSDLSLGALTGWGGGTQTPGFVLLGTASTKVVRHGWVPDVNNTVSVEVQAGPLWAGGATFFNTSVHLRWDFQKDARWSFYSLGGVAFTSGQGIFDLYPRVGLGAFYDVAQSFVIRAEFSREVLGAGVMFPLWF